MDNDDSDLDIAIVLGNNIGIRTECSGQSNDKVILCLVSSYITPQPGDPLRRQEEGTKMKNASVLQVEDNSDDEALCIDL
jgi:hypothetical protein